MLRSPTRQAIHQTLDDSYFGSSNFTIDFGNGNPNWFKITFIQNHTFNFTVNDINGIGAIGHNLEIYRYQVSEAPGVRLLTQDLSNHKNIENCIQRIPEWLKRVKEEIIDSNPFNREILAIRKQLEEQINEFTEQQEEYFTRQESDQLKQRLTEFAEKLDELAKQNIELQESINSLKGRIVELAGATDQVNKGIWYRMAGSKLIGVAKAIFQSKEGRELMLEAAKKILLEGPK
ncbi:MAG: hypothetical protein AB3X44_11075 [Leptothrix sp. (in: b-proteobacteria)]